MEKSSFLRRRYFVPIRIEELNNVIFQCAELQDVLKGTTYPDIVLDGRDLSSLQKYVFHSAFSFLMQRSRLSSRRVSSSAARTLVVQELRNLELTVHH